MIQEIKVRLTGEAPLLMHNGQLANPLNQHAKESKKISGKRQKTEADLEQLAKISWFGSLYLTDDLKIMVPGVVLEAALANGAKTTRKGKSAQAGLFVRDNMLLEFDHADLTLDELWKIKKFRLDALVSVDRKKILRVRPKFDNWAITANINFDDSLFNLESIRDIIKIAGEQIGLCDWRPRYGRFSVKFL